MYSSLPTFVVGFHGCDKEVQEKVLLNKEGLCPSENDYDWLGNGIYFWENNPERALQFAELIKKFPDKHSTKINESAVIGAVIDLGSCLNLVDARYIKMLNDGYKTLKETVEKAGAQLPVNKVPDTGGHPLIRNLDYAVIQTVHKGRETAGQLPFDTVRGVFQEGKEIYTGSGFKTKTHIQLCVKNPNCIKGYFHPRELDGQHRIP
jgi:hypothetical protein